MKWEQRRLLEMAGILRRGTPNHLLTEGDDEGGDDSGGDPFADDGGGDDTGGDDLFGGDDDGGEGGDTAGEDSEESAEGSNRIPPEELTAGDIEKFGSPRFLDIDLKIKNMFNDSFVSASVGAQEVEAAPGVAIEDDPTPAKDDDPEETEDDEKNESFYRYGSRRDKWLISEANRLLVEAESEGAASDEFDMERFATELANYMDNIHNTEDVEAGIFNMARQMVLNNFGQETESEFIDMLASASAGKWSFIQDGFSDTQEAPIAVGASKDAAGA